MSAPRLSVVTFGGGAGALAAWPAARVIDAADFVSPHDLAHAAGTEQASVLWLPPWTVPSPALVSAVTAWLEEGRTERAQPRVARACLRRRGDGAAITLAAPRLVLSGPASAELTGELPLPRQAAQVTDLAAPWDVDLPPDLASHLDAVNAQSSIAARLRHAAGRSATWWDLTLAPLAVALRGLAAVDGSRRQALPRLVIEAYRGVLIAAKQWELAHPAAAT